MNVIIAKNKVTEERIVFFVPDAISHKAVAAKMNQELGKDVAKTWDIDIVDGSLVEICQSPVAVAQALR